MQLVRSLKFGIVAGVVAGLVLGVLLFVLQEPLIDRAICYEQTGGPTCTIQDEMIPRVYQKLVLVLASPLIGLALGIFFALAYGSFYPYLPVRTNRSKGMVLALMGYLLYPLLPSLRLLPLPPGVENTLSADDRGLWYGLMVLGGILALGLGFALYHLLVRRDGSKRGHVRAGILSLVVMVVIAAIPVLFFPGTTLSGNSTADPGLILQYQVVTILVEGVFWFTLGYIFSTLWTRAETARPAPMAADAPV